MLESQMTQFVRSVVACRDAVNTVCVKQRGHGQVEVCWSHLGWHGVE